MAAAQARITPIARIVLTRTAPGTPTQALASDTTMPGTGTYDAPSNLTGPVAAVGAAEADLIQPTLLARRLSAPDVGPAPDWQNSVLPSGDRKIGAAGCPLGTDAVPVQAATVTLPSDASGATAPPARFREAPGLLDVRGSRTPRSRVG